MSVCNSIAEIRQEIRVTADNVEREDLELRLIFLVTERGILLRRQARAREFWD